MSAGPGQGAAGGCEKPEMAKWKDGVSRLTVRSIVADGLASVTRGILDYVIPTR